MIKFHQTFCCSSYYIHFNEVGDDIALSRYDFLRLKKYSYLPSLSCHKCIMSTSSKINDCIVFIFYWIFFLSLKIQSTQVLKSTFQLFINCLLFFGLFENISLIKGVTISNHLLFRHTMFQALKLSIKGVLRY